MPDLNRLLFIAAEEHVFPFDLGLKPLHGRGHTAFHVAGGKEQGEGQERRLAHEEHRADRQDARPEAAAERGPPHLVTRSTEARQSQPSPSHDIPVIVLFRRRFSDSECRPFPNSPFLPSCGEDEDDDAFLGLASPIFLASIRRFRCLRRRFDPMLIRRRGKLSLSSQNEAPRGALKAAVTATPHPIRPTLFSRLEGLMPSVSLTPRTFLLASVVRSCLATTPSPRITPSCISLALKPHCTFLQT